MTSPIAAPLGEADLLGDSPSKAPEGDQTLGFRDNLSHQGQHLACVDRENEQ